MAASPDRRWLALALISVVQFMVVLDIAIVNVALPSIKVDLGFSQENLQWVISAYALAFGGFLLLGGRAADLLGRRRVFVAGLVLFAAGSIVAGLAWSEASLIGARSLQGLGAAVISPAALSILMTTFGEGRERNIALGVWGAVGMFGAAAGVLLGGIFTDLLSWEWIFFINVPVAVGALVLTPILLAESRDARGRGFDALGAVLVTSGLSTSVFAITKANDYGWTSAKTIGLFAMAAALLGAFVAVERRTEDPLMSFSIFKIKTVTGANVAGFILGTALFSMFLMLTLYMQQVLGYSALKSGFAYLAVAGTSIFWATLASQLVTKIGVKTVLVTGMSLLDGRDALLHPGLGRRFVRARPATGVLDRRGRDVLRVRVRLDRGPGRYRDQGRRTRVRDDQHVAADRRRTRDRDPLVGCGGRDRIGGPRRRQRAGGTDDGLPRCVLGRRCHCRPRRDRLGRVDPKGGARHRSGRRGRRAGGGAGARGLACADRLTAAGVGGDLHPGRVSVFA